MSGGKISYPIIFIVVLIALNVYCICDSQKKVYEMHECEHQMTDTVLLVNKKIERNLKEIQHIILKLEDKEKLELRNRNYELEWCIDKLTQELLNMFNLLRGKEMPSNRSLGETNV